MGNIITTTTTNNEISSPIDKLEQQFTKSLLTDDDIDYNGDDYDEDVDIHLDEDYDLSTIPSAIVHFGVKEFLRALLSIDVTHLNVAYRETVIVDHLKQKEFGPLICGQYEQLKQKLVKMVKEKREKNKGKSIQDNNVGDDSSVTLVLPLQYQSMAHFCLYFAPLIVINCWAQLVTDYFTDCSTTGGGGGYKANHIKQRRQLIQQYQNFSMKIIFKDYDPEEKFWVIKLLLDIDYPYDKSGPKYWLAGWLVLLYLNENKSSPSNSTNGNDGPLMANTIKPGKMALGYIEEQESNEFSFIYTLRLYDSDDNVWVMRSSTIIVHPVYYIRPTIRTVEKLNYPNWSESPTKILLRPIDNLVGINTTLSSTSISIPRWKFWQESQYNATQRETIIKCCTNVLVTKYHEATIQLVQGPPGTGKTHTLLGVMSNLLLNNRTRIGSRLLVIAPSNGAIDQLAKRFISNLDQLEQELGYQLEIYRLGLREQVDDSVKHLLLDSNLQKKMHNYQGTYKSCKTLMISNAHVIFSTLASCYQLPDDITSFSAVIIDEASQCTEPELWQALSPGSTVVRSVILFGDHLQLPATVISQHATNLGYDRSTFERYYQVIDYDCRRRRNLAAADNNNDQSTTSATPTSSVIMLNEQYRMQKDICHFPSNFFYNGLLKTSIEKSQNISTNSILSNVTPYMVFDIFNSVEAQHNRSRFNSLEAEFVFKLLQILLPHQTPKNENDSSSSSSSSSLHKFKWSKGSKTLPTDHQQEQQQQSFSVGVITFYKGQKEEIIRLLAHKARPLLRKVMIDTVDAFQGQEKDIIILSCVRAFAANNGDHKSIGFIRSRQRMNVALTRARSAMYVVMNRRTICVDPSWRALVDDAQQRNLLRYNIHSERMGLPFLRRLILKDVAEETMPNVAPP